MVDQDGLRSTALDHIVCGKGGLHKKTKKQVREVVGDAAMPGPTGLWSGPWVPRGVAARGCVLMATECWHASPVYSVSGYAPLAGRRIGYGHVWSISMY